MKWFEQFSEIEKRKEQEIEYGNFLNFLPLHKIETIDI